MGNLRRFGVHKVVDTTLVYENIVTVFA